MPLQRFRCLRHYDTLSPMLPPCHAMSVTRHTLFIYYDATMALLFDDSAFHMPYAMMPLRYMPIIRYAALRR